MSADDDESWSEDDYNNQASWRKGYLLHLLSAVIIKVMFFWSAKPTCSLFYLVGMYA